MGFEEYRALLEETPVTTRLVEFRDPDGLLVAASLTDRVASGLSGVYKFFCPDAAGQSLGSFVILWHVHRAAELGLPYVYLGYWIALSPKMAYKARFQPMEALTAQGWLPMAAGVGMPAPPLVTAAPRA